MSRGTPARLAWASVAACVALGVLDLVLVVSFMHFTGTYAGHALNTAALDGEPELRSAPGGGTTVAGRIPTPVSEGAR